MATRNLFFSVALLMVSLLFSLIVGEIVLRLLGYAGAPEALIGNIRHVDDPMLNWRFVPNSTVQDGNVRVHYYNDAGFRDAEHAVEKSAHITRVIYSRRLCHRGERCKARGTVHQLRPGSPRFEV
jgi:hypothetical protein